MHLAAYIAIAAGAYLMGSIPFGYLVGRWKGIDIRAAGSGNIGATNVFRILGKPAGVFVLFMDALKGYAATAWMAGRLHEAFGVAPDRIEASMLVAGVAAVMGHNYTCWLRFKGGKGIATSAGVLLALVPGALAIILSVWIVLTLVTGFVSVGSIAASAVLPFASWATGESWTLIVATGAMGALAIFKHRSNIQRLLQGTEKRIQSRRKEAAS